MQGYVSKVYTSPVSISTLQVVSQILKVPKILR